MSNKIIEEVKNISALVGNSFGDAVKSDSGFVTAGIRLRRQMKTIIEKANEVRRLVIEVREETKKNDIDS